MEDNTKRRPFYKIFIGVISALIAIGGLFGVLGSIMLPDDSFLGDSFLGYLFVCVIFTIMAVYFLKPEKTEREKDNERKSKKFFVSFLRVVIFIAVWIIMCIIGKLCYPSPISPKGETHLHSINTTSLFGSDDFNNWLKDSTNIKLVNSAASEWDDLTQDELEGLKRHLYINSRIKQDLGEDVYDSMPDTLRLREKVDYYNNHLPKDSIKQTGSSLGYIVFSLLGIIFGIVVAYFCPLPTKRRGVVKSPESGSVAIKDKSINPNRAIRFLRWLVSRCPKWVIVAYLVLVWINIGLLIGSFQARSWRGYFYVPFNSYSSDEIVSLHDWEKPQNIIFPFPSRYSASDGACTGIGWISAWDIKTYDWTEFLAYLIIPFLCIVTCILVLERTDKLKDAPPDDSTQKENEEI